MSVPRAWTPERVAMLRAEYPTSTDTRALLHRINALPGRAVPTLNAVGTRAHALGVKKSPEAAAAILARCGEHGARNLPTGERRTPERAALLRAIYPTATTRRELLDAVNALPGPPFEKMGTLRLFIAFLGLRKTPETHRAIKRRVAAENKANGAPKPRAPRPPKPAPAFALPAPPPMRRERAVVKPATVRPAPVAPAPVDPGIARYERAKRMIEQRKDPAAVAASVGLPLWRVLGIVGEVRRECRA